MWHNLKELILYCSFLQVPFIAFYRKEYVEPELNINDLWKVWQWDEKVNLLLHLCRRMKNRQKGKCFYKSVNSLGAQPDGGASSWGFVSHFWFPDWNIFLHQWTQLKTRKQNLTRLFRKMQSYQYEQISADPDKPLADGIRPLDTADMERCV